MEEECRRSGGGVDEVRRGRTLHLQLLVQGPDIVLDPLDELGLVLTDGAADVRPHKQRVEPERGGGGGEGQEEEEPGEDAEHLVGVLGGAELVPHMFKQESENDTVNSMLGLLFITLNHTISYFNWKSIGFDVGRHYLAALQVNAVCWSKYVLLSFTKDHYFLLRFTKHSRIITRPH